MDSAPVRLSLVMAAMKILCIDYRQLVRESKANRKKAKKERKRTRRDKFRTKLIACGMMTRETKKQYEKEENEEDSYDEDAVSDGSDEAELARIDGMEKEHRNMFHVSEFFIGR